MRQTWHIAAVMRSSMTGCDVSDTRGTDSPASQMCVKIVQHGRQLCAKRTSLRSGKSLMLTSRLCTGRVDMEQIQNNLRLKTGNG